MRNKLAKNSIAVGLVTLIVTAGLSFSAQAAPTFKSHGEAQFISAGDPALGAILDGLGAAIEGVDACEPAEATCPASDTQANSALLPLPLNGLTGLSLGAANNFAQAGASAIPGATGGKSRAASGAVSDSGTINTGGGGQYPSNAVLNLAPSALSGLTALADLDISLGAISSTADMAAPASAAVRDYNIAGGTVVLTIPALETLGTALGGAVGGTLGDIDNISLTTICTALAAVPALDLICAALPALVTLDISVPTLNSVLGNISNLTAAGLIVNLANGTVTVDINALLAAANLPGINDLPPNTDLLNYLLPAVVGGVDDLVDNLVDGLVANILANSSITLTLGGVPLVLDAAQLGLVITPLTNALSTLLGTLTPPLATALSQITAGLAPLVKVLVNVPDVANNDLVDPAGPAGTTASETAVRVLLANGQLLDLRLATSVVGPNTVVPDAAGPTPTPTPTTAAAAPAAAGPGDVPDADAAADADSQADADVTTALPAAGSPNLLPFWMLGLGLLLFGATVLLNEKRRLEL